MFVPPPGEEVRAPETASHREYSLAEVAEAASFRVFTIPELPDGQWRLDVRFHERRERPPIPALVTLVYHRSDGRGSLVVSERAAGEGAESWPAVDPQLEDVERDGVGYTILRGDREHGGSPVSRSNARERRSSCSRPSSTSRCCSSWRRRSSPPASARAARTGRR